MYRRRRDVIWRRGAERIVVMNVAGDEVIVLRGTGAAIWNALATPKAPEEVASGLGEDYGRTPEALLDEVQPFIEQLANHRLVEPVEP